ncbi:MAG TPA: LuxR C-terminal-related transcriptional regulator [Ktedonobacteraceae bacterium]|nr:LuxR C-terminal-related transcriptional regulator [Ktedonobacteraceae bacterium]
MEQLDTLLQLIAHLQDNTDNVHGRQLLLEFARTSSTARLALLFRLDTEHQQLHLLARNGRPPRHVSGSHNSENIPLFGCFGSALDTQSFLSIPDLHANKRSLPEERCWTWPGGPVILCNVGGHGILVLCYAPQKSAKTHDASMPSPTFDKDTLRIYVSLLSGYLTTADHQTGQLPPVQSQAVLSLPNPLQTASPHFEAVIDRERERIARDIHDGPAQQIAAVLHRLEYIQRILLKRPQEALHEIEQARQNLDEGLHDLRQCIATPIPTQLQQRSLTAALQTFKQDDGHLHITIELSNLASVPATLEVPIYRFVQEALNNVRKHAQATQAIVRVRLLPRLLFIEVSDDGKGFDSKTFLNSATLKIAHLGLRTMRDRVREAGGTWEIHSTPGAGTTVRARFPLATRTAPTIPVLQVSSLTNRERDVLRLVIDGLTNRAIAEQLSVSTETVKSHVHHIMQKMNAKDRTHAAVLATRQHWV